MQGERGGWVGVGGGVLFCLFVCLIVHIQLLKNMLLTIWTSVYQLASHRDLECRL